MPKLAGAQQYRTWYRGVVHGDFALAGGTVGVTGEPGDASGTVELRLPEGAMVVRAYLELASAGQQDTFQLTSPDGTQAPLEGAAEPVRDVTEQARRGGAGSYQLAGPPQPDGRRLSWALLAVYELPELPAGA